MMTVIIYNVNRHLDTLERLDEMKVSREQAAQNRERILDVASKLFRERGFDGIGVADLMKGAGFTHGGFYGHFSSKEELMAQACARALATSLDRWGRLVERTPEDPLSALTSTYLSTRHRDHPGTGCLLATLGADVSRRSAPVRHALTEGLRSLVEVLIPLVPGKSKAAKRDKALAIYASYVGALVLARAVDDPALSEDILKAVTASLSGEERRSSDPARHA
jgi:TetR/AcrR family transcriptional regulator, transcriptional repressor for nem operon